MAQSPPALRRPSAASDKSSERTSILNIKPVELAALDPEIALEVLGGAIAVDRRNFLYEVLTAMMGWTLAAGILVLFALLLRWGFEKSAYAVLGTEVLGVIGRFQSARR